MSMLNPAAGLAQTHQAAIDLTWIEVKKTQTYLKKIKVIVE